MIVAGGSGLGLVALPVAGASTDGFTTTGSLQTARDHATATVLGNGLVLVAGGQNASGTPLSSAELYDPANGSFAPTDPLPVAVTQATATMLSNGDVLVAGGLTKSSAGKLTPTGASEIYDPSRRTWSVTNGSLATPIYGASAALLSSGQVLVAGGLTSAALSATATTVAELFDPGTGTWSSTTSLHVGVARAASAAVNGGAGVLVAGGETGASGNLTAVAEVYELSSHSWSYVDHLPKAVAEATATVLETGKVLVAGGETSTGGSPTKTGQRFDPTSGSWTTVGSLPFASYGATATRLASGDVVYVGGLTSGAGAPTAKAALYDPGKAAWTSAASLSLARGYAVAARLGSGDVLVAGGMTASGVTGESELYSPASSPPPGTAPAFTTPANVQLRAGHYANVTIRATGTPTPRLTESGSLPPGLGFHAYDNGTATIAGVPHPGGRTSYEVTITADNGIGAAAVQHLVLSFTSAPGFTSPAHVTIQAKHYTTIRVTTSGSPPPILRLYGRLPPGLQFRAYGNGTATIAGVPRPSRRTTYKVTIDAHNGIGRTAVQHLTLAYSSAPTFTSPASRTLRAGHYANLKITTKGSPTPQLYEYGALPPGLRFEAQHNGTALIRGVPRRGLTGTYQVTITADNGVGKTAVQHLALRFSQAPTISAPSSLSLTDGGPVRVTIGSTGTPTPKITLRGKLPPGLGFHPGPHGTARITGKVRPGVRGTYTVTLYASNGVGRAASKRLRITATPPAPPTNPRGIGYWYATSDGQVVWKGAARPIAPRTPQHPRDVVGMARTPDGGGYYLVSSYGGVFNYGDAPYFGSIAARHLRSRTVALAVPPQGDGYYEVTRAGNVFDYGKARFYGSLARRRVPPVVAMAVTPDGHGYWLVTSHGNVFGFGDARFYGSPAHLRIHDVTAFAPTPDGHGYWVVTTTGAVYTYGDAVSYGSFAGRRIPPVTAFAPTADGHGYWIVTIRGNIFNEGDARFFGSSAHTRLAPVKGFVPEF